jgi:HPr kinase/phosphorylase
MLFHASCVSIEGRGVLLRGPSGVGKSDLALRLVDGGAKLVSDDQTRLRIEKGALVASVPEQIEGMIEIRHVGLMKFPFVRDVPLALCVELGVLDDKLERMPELISVFFLDHPVQQLRLPAFAASTPAKIRAVLAQLMIDDRNTAPHSG